MNKVAIIGAGLSGATCARMLAESNVDFDITVFEHELIGGMCADIKNSETGIVQSLHGPHIFHTNEQKAFDFIKRFDKNSTLNKYDHQVRAYTRLGFTSWPINRNTIRKAFGRENYEEAKQLWNYDIERTIAIHKHDDDSFEKRAMCKVGEVLYNLLIKGYTEKQWQMLAKEVPAEIFKRVRIEDSESNSFFNDKYVYMPENGFTPIIEEMLRHDRIHVKYAEIRRELLVKIIASYDVIISTVMPDELLLDEQLLPTNNISFCRIDDSFLGLFKLKGKTPITNICCNVEWIDAVRITDYTNLFHHNVSEVKGPVIAEVPNAKGERLYPINTESNDIIACTLIRFLKKLGVDSLGRCGTYKYLNMDQAILQAMDKAEEITKRCRNDNCRGRN